ncbi:MAG: cysteine hydrolase family protein [Propionibacteriaceae bacterium]|jgi:nicotinamidase-related amidase|nr:cysteine hydrolase [Micropruina sp.]HBX81349.1 hypothetical protein [Propionibacteriaceae bacterium]HBY24071.1 hypothetical protein [Propionibacteriaceae bacterium]
MTTLPRRPNKALLVIDMQNDAAGPGSHDRERVIENIQGLLDQARAANAPVIWVQHSDQGMPIGSEGWQFVPELAPAEGEPVVHKTFRDAFEATELESLLATRGVGHLVVTGAQTDFCVRSTLHGALVRGYDATLVSDAHTTEDLSEWGAPPPGQVIAHTNLYWDGQKAPGRAGDTLTAADIEF